MRQFVGNRPALAPRPTEKQEIKTISDELAQLRNLT
jgi:hypothetical protein